jgi:rhamnosyl/mannosyltransferase
MRVLHAYKGYLPEMTGGVPEVISVLTRKPQADVDSRVAVCTADHGNPRDIVAGIPVTRAPAWFEALSMPIAPAFPAMLRREAAAADVLVAHLPFPLIDIGIALGLPAPTALVVYWHSEIYGRQPLVSLLAPLFRRTLARADRIVVSDRSMIENSQFLDRDSDKNVVVPLGTDVDYWSTLEPGQGAEAAALRAAYPRLILAIGRLVPYKGYETLIKALAATDATLIIVGEGPQRGRLERLIATLGLGERVFLRGFMPRPQLKVHLNAARALAFPSVTAAETFGIAQIEAMAAGLPIVNTLLATGVPRVARNGMEAITVPPNDAAALAWGLNALLDDPDLAQRLGRAGAARARERYGLDDFVAAMTDVFRAALAARRAALSPEERLASAGRGSAIERR